MACLDHMRLGDAAQDELVVGMRVEDAVLQDRYVRVGAFGHDAVTVQDRLGHTCSRCLLGVQHRREQVERLEVVVAEPPVLGGDDRDRCADACERLRTDVGPEFAGHPLIIDMVARGDATGDLPVHELEPALHLREQFMEQRGELGLSQGDRDVECTCVGIEAVKVLVEQEERPVGTHGDIVDAVPEEMRAVVEGDHQLVGTPGPSIIVGDALHGWRAPPLRVGTCISSSAAMTIQQASWPCVSRIRGKRFSGASAYATGCCRAHHGAGRCRGPVIR